MTSQTLREARKYEETFEKHITKEMRPDFHLSPRTGWMNDPNGFSYYMGKYHLFYQYNPYDAYWDNIHWGHAVSDDLLHWEYLPAALAPDESYDRDGCFSGSAVTLPDGRQLLLYTSVRREHQPDGTIQDIQSQSVAVGNGLDYEKYAGNPVITEADLPEGGSRFDFRDPKLWQAEDGTYRCVVGNRPADGSGQILLYTSRDGFHWDFKSILVSNQCRFGRMWECPDFFELDGKWVLLTSPQDMLPQDLEYHNGNGTLCLTGSYDEETGTFTEDHDQAIDYGIDFYAAQTLLTPDGRRVMIGWMQNWDACSHRGENTPWFGQTSLPRELSIRNGRLYQWPIRELEALRRGKVERTGLSFSGDLSLEGVRGRRVDLEIALRPKEGAEPYHKFALRFAKNELYQTSLSYHPAEAILKLDRKFSGSRKAIIHQRRCQLDPSDGVLRLRVILDRFSAEVFVNGGEKVMTANIYTDQDADQIAFFADGEVEMDLVKYDLCLE